MSRFAVIALAVVIGWGASLDAARATGARGDHSPGHSAKADGAPFTSPQEGTVPAERHKIKQGTRHIRGSTSGDKATPKHAYRQHAAERHRTKQSARNIRQSGRTAHLVTKDKSQLTSLQYRKLKRGVRSGHAAVKKLPAQEKQIGRHGSPRKS